MEGAGCVGCAVEVLGAGVAWGRGSVEKLVGEGKGVEDYSCVEWVGRRLCFVWE